MSVNYRTVKPYKVSAEDKPLIDKILNLKRVKELTDTGKVMCIRVDGSRAAGVYDKMSDYDITIMIDGETPPSVVEEDSIRYVINGNKVHFYIQGYDWFKRNYDSPISQYISVITGLFHYCDFDMDKIIYINPTYYEKIEKIIDNKILFVQHGLYCFLKNKNEYLGSLEKYKLIAKYTYSFIRAVAFVADLQYDDFYVKKIKKFYTEERHLLSGYDLMNRWVTEVLELNYAFDNREKILEDILK